MRAAKLRLLQLARSMGLFAVARRLTSRHVRILCYHGTWRAGGSFSGDCMFIRPETFARRLELLDARGYRVVTLDEALEIKAGSIVPDRPCVAITIDDGWYGTFADMLPALRRHGMPATLYCDTANLESGLPMAHVMAWYMGSLAGREPDTPQLRQLLQDAKDLARPMSQRLAALHALATGLDLDLEALLATRTFSYMTPAELARAAATGLAVELHTHNHSLHDMGHEAIRQEIALNRAALGRLLGRPPESFRHFCYPSGRASPEAAAILSTLGLDTATTLEARTAESGDDPWLLPRLIDGDNISEIEFEAEMSGFTSLVLARLGLSRSSHTRDEATAVIREPSPTSAPA
ncbi:MAG: polysaccharide deacetylase family protein [Hyphomicrobiaceae bacterium]|nr:polysaccharide deacetylase family protein [Hyphomicrobiaceae bacterium]